MLNLPPPPCGWIPPEYREFVYADTLDEEDMSAIRATMHVYDPDVDQDIRSLCPLTDDEIKESGVRRLKGVIDKRDGSYHPNRFFKD